MTYKLKMTNLPYDQNIWQSELQQPPFDDTTSEERSIYP